jgi:single-strand DNA-binding protein
MAKSVNKVILIGNLGKDPEVKYTQTGMAVARFSVATADRVKDKEGNWQERTEWHNLVAFQRTAEIAGEYLKKGSKKYKTEIIINDLVLLGGGGPREGGGEGGGYSGRSGAGKSSASGGFDQRTSEPDVSQAPASGGGPEITDEDIPF